MCGGQGLHHGVGALTAIRTRPPVDIVHELKLMYARGEIDGNSFRALIELEKQPNHVVSKNGFEPTSSNSDYESSHLGELQIELSRLYALAEDEEIKARHPELADDVVRAHLETRQGALFRAQRLEREIEALKVSK